MKSCEKLTSELMSRIRSMTPAEYNRWLAEGREITKTMLSASDIYFLQKRRKEQKIDAIMRAIHSDGLETWRKHNKS